MGTYILLGALPLLAPLANPGKGGKNTERENKNHEEERRQWFVSYSTWNCYRTPVRIGTLFNFLYLDFKARVTYSYSNSAKNLVSASSFRCEFRIGPILLHQKLMYEKHYAPILPVLRQLCRYTARQLCHFCKKVNYSLNLWVIPSN